MDGSVIIIRTVEDLIQLDERQLDSCLKDLKTWVNFRKDLDAKIEMGKDLCRKMGMSEELINASVETQDHMAWVDDGIEGGKLNVHIKTSADATDGMDVNFSVAPDGKITHTNTDGE